MAQRTDSLRPGEVAYGGPLPGSDGPVAPPPEHDPRSVGDLFKELVGETTTLLKQEVALAKTEVRQEVRTAARNAALVAAGGAVAYAALIVLLVGLGFLLGEILGDDYLWLGLVLIGALGALAGYLLFKKGMDTLREIDPTPERTVETLKNDKQWLQNETRELTR